MLPNDYNQRQVRPMSEVINSSRFMSDADVAASWYEDLQNYERNLDEMASTTLDQHFKEEMQHVDQWYRYLTEAEKTATMYTLLQHSSQVQARFFINLLQQMVKRDPLFSLLAPGNNEQDMQNHLAGAMAKAELEASQRLMSVLPYKTGQVISRPPSSTNRRTVDRHSFALGDTEEYNRLFGTRNDFTTPNGRPASYVNSLLDDPLATVSNATRRMNGNSTTSNGSNTTTRPHSMFNNGGRPHSVIEGDTTSLFPNWISTIPSTSSTMRRQPAVVGHIGDRKLMPERPKSADISNWALPTATTSTDSLLDRSNGFASVWGNAGQTSPLQQQASQQQSAQQQTQSVQQQQQMDNELLDFASNLQQPYRRRANVNRIPVVPETDEMTRNNAFLDDSSFRITAPGIEHYSNYLLTPPTPQQQQHKQKLQGIIDGTSNLTIDEHGYASDHSDGSHISRRQSSMIPNNNGNSIITNSSSSTGIGGSRATKDKKAVEVVDMDLLKDVPAWLRSLRLHKYNSIFSEHTWQEIVKMSDEELLAKGVAALGARRKMLKVFENIKNHCEANNIEY
ncbi:hypothetical protein BD560DRAFT_403264 [Blakeslea trispora]|nr:hypothetical protein BD560DRAFT_403264 [Blakeslea trispora]